MTLPERLERLTPRQRQAVDLVVTLFLLANEGDGDPAVPPDAEYSFSDTLDLFHSVMFDEFERDFHELRRILRYGIEHAVQALEGRPGSTEVRNQLLIWQLIAADIDMAWYLHTGDQGYRRNAVARFNELIRVLEKQKQTYHVREAIEHARTFSRRLNTRYKTIEPLDADDALHLCKFYTADFDMWD